MIEDELALFPFLSNGSIVSTTLCYIVTLYTLPKPPRPTKLESEKKSVAERMS